MRAERTAEVAASPERVWDVLMDVERWPEWTASMAEVRLGADGMRVGARATVRQPKLPPATWEVTELTENSRFTWMSRSAGVTTVAEHEITPTGGGCRVRLALNQTGFLAPLVGALFGKLTIRYVELELAGLKERSENES